MTPNINGERQKLTVYRTKNPELTSKKIVTVDYMCKMNLSIWVSHLKSLSPFVANL